MATNTVKNVIINVKSNTKGIDNLTKAVDKLEKENKQLAKSYKETNDKLQQQTKKSEKSVGNLGSAMSKIGGVIAGAFAVDRLVAFGKAVLDTRAEFQKLEAVLTNTLGSKSEAQLALAQIQQFASETPFSVVELTQSFVKLVNQGFKPTSNELRQLGDLASSTGKSFDQLTEAIIDAQTGEFERLKEFGIRAKKEGDKVKFTFKEVETQVDFTSSSIQDYILSLGDLEGVSGAMVAISGTLGGKISNLGDSWDSLLNTLGTEGEGIYSMVIDFLSQMTGGLEKLILSTEKLQEKERLSFAQTESRIAVQNLMNEGLTEQQAVQKLLSTSNDDLASATKNLSEWEQRRKDLIEDTEGRLFLDESTNHHERMRMRQDELKIADEAIEQLNLSIPQREKFIKVYNEYLKQFEKGKDIQENEIQTIGFLQAKLKDLTDSIKDVGIGSGEAVVILEQMRDVQRQIDTELGKNNPKYKERIELIAERNKLLETAAENEKKLADKQKDFQDGIRQAEVDALIDQLAEQDKIRAANLEKWEKEEIAAAERRNEIRQEFEAELINSAVSVAGTLFDIQRNALDAETQYKLDILNSQLESEQITQKQFEELRKGIFDEETRREKQLATFEVILAGAQAIAKVWASDPNPAVALPLSALVGAQILTQLALVNSTQPPKYEKGGWIDGKRHRDGGTMIEAEKDEFVVNRNDAMKNKELLHNLNKGNAMDYINKNYIIPAIKQNSLADARNNSLADNIAQSLLVNAKFNDGRIVGQLDLINKNSKKNNEKLISVLRTSKQDLRNV